MIAAPFGYHGRTVTAPHRDAPMTRRKLRTGILAAALIVVGAALASADAAAVLRHGASVSERNALIVEVRVALARAARVFVEYDNPQAGRYRTPLSEPGAAHAIPLVRLRPETTYDYTIFVVDGSVTDEAAVDGAHATAGPRGRFTTGPLPLALAAIPMQVRGRSSQPLILSDQPRAYYVFQDEVGGIVWYHYHEGLVGPIAQLPAGSLLFARGGSLVEITPLGAVVNRFARGGAAGNPHHDVAVLDAERVIYLSRARFVFDDSANGGPAQDASGFADQLRVWDRGSGHFEQVWDSTDAWDLPDPAQRGARTRTGSNFSWTHLNSVSIGPRGNVVLSSRARNQVVSLSVDSWTIEWQLNGPDSDYEFPNPNDRFYGQHTAAQLDDGNVLLFDNGRGRPDAEGGAYSRALELRLDEAAGTAVKVWEYRPTPDIYSASGSSAYRLSNGNTLINFVARLSDPPMTVVEVDAAGNEVFRVVARQRYVPRPHSSRRYRAYGGIESIMGETMLRPPAAAPAYARAATFEKEYYLAKERARFEELAAALDGRQRAAGGVFDLYLAGDRLVYAKEPCARADVRERFFLHVFPAGEDDLAADSREQGFDNLDFDFWTRGVLWDGACLVAATLPEYEIVRLRTGQFISGQGQLWAAEIEAPAAARKP